jgi:hypothetical protein
MRQSATVFRELHSSDNIAIEYSRSQNVNHQQRRVVEMTDITSYTRNDVRPGAIFTTPDNIQCRVDRMEGDKVFLTVLHNKDIDGKHEIALPLSEMQNNRWKLTKQAA